MANVTPQNYRTLRRRYTGNVVTNHFRQEYQPVESRDNFGEIAGRQNGRMGDHYGKVDIPVGNGGNPVLGGSSLNSGNISDILNRRRKLNRPRTLLSVN